MTNDENKSGFASELEAIHSRLVSIEESIKNLTAAIQSLTVCSEHSVLSAP